MDIIHTAYFDENGKLIIINSGGVMSPPESAAYSERVTDPYNYNIYYDDGVKTKQKFPVVAEKNKLSGIPQGTRVVVEGQAEVVEDGVMEFDVNYEGWLNIFLENPYYLSESLLVEVGP